MKDSERSAIGGSSTLGVQNFNYNVMPEQAIKTLQQGSGNVGEFIVIQQTRQGEQPRVWSSGDPEQTRKLFEHAGQLFPQTTT